MAWEAQSPESTRGKSRRSSLSKRKLYYGNLYIIAVIIMVFWAGVFVSSHFLHSGYIQSSSTQCTCEGSTKINNHKGDLNENKEKTPEFVKLSDPEFVQEPEKNLKTENNKLILLYRKKIWTKFDSWTSEDWRKKCPQQPNCRITFDTNLLRQSSAVVFNGLHMPSVQSAKHMNDIRAQSKTPSKFVFLSGLTPLETSFDPSLYEGLFDMTITYKQDSNIRIPYWPNDPILPSMLRAKEPSRVLTEEEEAEFKQSRKHFFDYSDKTNFMAFVIKKCGSQLFPNAWMKKMREEGTIDIFTIDNCTNILPDTKIFPCKNLYSDECCKLMEKYKFVAIPEYQLCKDYVSRDYWYSLMAWETVPVVWGAADYKKVTIANTFVNGLESDYISPAFKEARKGSEDTGEYNRYLKWTQEQRVDTFYWQCELCQQLYSNDESEKEPIVFSEFWGKEQNCGPRTEWYKLAKAQLVRTGAIVS